MKVYTFSIGMFPVWEPNLAETTAKELKKLDGFIGVHPLTHPETLQEATILIFDSYNNAIKGREVMKQYDNVGKYIVDGELSDDMQTLTIGDAVERS